LGVVFFLMFLPIFFFLLLLLLDLLTCIYIVYAMYPSLNPPPHQAPLWNKCQVGWFLPGCPFACSEPVRLIKQAECTAPSTSGTRPSGSWEPLIDQGPCP
jgi:hypothetical protein